ncbi:DUF4254 domain-containing protein [Rhodopirellula sp. JC740]|uniref:DUF4254 domain-containing protein n=1 Tax=Rhodopirellula halodulae TaxID=2894198 RepID=A0ABS8NDT4_9BACT|nr:DUF4254 domain-containing protein [Rhodopirellula sp. JC740]MCC9641712.1 DUF4254 domain-containing protein [Rhodopirellula sp. JC740]
MSGPANDPGRLPTVTGQVEDWTRLQIDCVRRWHDEPIANPHSGWLAWVCQQHAFNFQLWHEEDVARNPNVTDARIAQVKRSIDRLNQQRNDWIEKLDDAITESIHQSGVAVSEDAPINTETPGSAIDRLSIMSLRLYHYAEHLQRKDVDAEHRTKVETRWLLCQVQHADLSASLQTLMDDLFAGRKRHKTYRQMKMYNDPSLNPEMTG